MEIDEPNVDDETSAHGVPCCGQPSLLDESIDQDVEVRIAILVEFEHRDVFRSGPELPSQIGPKLVERVAQVYDGIALHLPGVKRQSHEPLQLKLLSCGPYGVLITPGSPWTTVSAPPTLAIQPLILGFLADEGLPH